MSIFDPKNPLVISKVTIGDQIYYLKDYEARELLAQLGTAAKKDVSTNGVSAEEQGLVTGAQVQTAIANLTGAMHFQGVVEQLPTTAENGDVYIVGVKEYVWANSEFHELGDETLYALKTITIGTQDLSKNISLDTLKTDLGLGALAYKSTASGTVAGQTITGVKATGTSTGSIAVELTQTSTAAAVTKADYTPSGDVTGNVTAAGTVAIAKSETGTQISGAVSAPEITVTPNTDTIKKVTSVGTLPTKTADIFNANGDDEFTQGTQASWSASVDNETETLSFSFTANTLPTFTQGAKASFTEGTFNAGTLPTLATEGTSVVTGIASATATQPVFTGDKFGATFTGSQVDISANFTGDTTKIVDTVSYDKATVNTANTKFTGAAIELDVGEIAVGAKEVTVQ